MLYEDCLSHSPAFDRAVQPQNSRPVALFGRGMWFGRGTPHPARSPSDGERVTIRAWGGLSADAAGFLSSGVSLLAAVGSPAPCASARLLSRWSPSSSRATRKKGSTHSLHPVLFNHFLRFGPAPGTPPPGARATGSTSPCPGCSRPGGMEAQHAYATHPTIHCQHPAIPSGIGHNLFSYFRGVAPLNPGLRACRPSGVPGRRGGLGGRGVDGKPCSGCGGG